MYENSGYLISGASILVALVAASGIYPAYRLFAQRTRRTRTFLWTVIGLAAAAPLAIQIHWELSLAFRDHPNARALQMMSVTFDQLLFLYLASFFFTALLLWAWFAWHKRTAA